MYGHYQCYFAKTMSKSTQNSRDVGVLHKIVLDILSEKSITLQIGVIIFKRDSAYSEALQN